MAAKKVDLKEYLMVGPKVVTMDYRSGHLKASRMVLKMVIVTVDHWEDLKAPMTECRLERLKELVTVLKRVDLKVVMKVKEMVLNLVLN